MAGPPIGAALASNALLLADAAARCVLELRSDSPSRRKSMARRLKSAACSTITQCPHSVRTRTRAFLQVLAMVIAPLTGQNLSLTPQNAKTGQAISLRSGTRFGT